MYPPKRILVLTNVTQCPKIFYTRYIEYYLVYGIITSFNKLRLTPNIKFDYNLVWKSTMDQRGSQVSHQRWTWVVHCTQGKKHWSQGIPPWLWNTEQTSPEVQNWDTNGPQIKAFVYKFFIEKKKIVIYRSSMPRKPFQGLPWKVNTTTTVAMAQNNYDSLLLNKQDLLNNCANWNFTTYF